MKPKKPTKDDFATLLMDRIRQAGEKSKLVYNPEAYFLRGEAEHSITIYLDDPTKKTPPLKTFVRKSSRSGCGAGFVANVACPTILQTPSPI